MRVALIACSATKHAAIMPARDLYTGNLYRLSRAWVEARGDFFAGWGILSAKHGLVLPDQVLSPYDLSMDDLTNEQQKQWAERVTQALADRWGLGTIYSVLAGADYTCNLRNVPFVEDIFRGWLENRRNRGLRGRVGIGWLMQQLKQGRGRA